MNNDIRHVMNVYDRVSYVNDFDGNVGIGSRIIVKRTQTRIYVSTQLIDHYEPCYGCFIIDRAAFERDGRIYARQAHETLYATRELAEAQIAPELVEEMHRAGKTSICKSDYYRSLLTPEQLAEHKRRVDEYLRGSPFLPEGRAASE